MFDEASSYLSSEKEKLPSSKEIKDLMKKQIVEIHRVKKSLMKILIIQGMMISNMMRRKVLGRYIRALFKVKNQVNQDQNS